MRHYQHTQIGWLTIGSVVLAALFLLPRLGSAGFWVASVVVAIAVLVLLMFATLTVILGDTGVELRFGIGLIRKRVPLSEIRSYRGVRNRWYYGWGIRIIPGGMLWNISGLSAVELLLTSGKFLRIGTDEPSALLAAFERALGTPQPLSAEETGKRERREKRWAMVVGGVVALLMLAVAALIYFEMRPPTVSVSPDVLSVRGGVYGVEIPLDEITSVSLEETLPRVLRRNNGFALRGTLRGHFRLEGLGNGQLFLERNQPPYLVVLTQRGFVIVNLPEPERTRQVYEELAGYLDGR